jgi:hypothetical protein
MPAPRLFESPSTPISFGHNNDAGLYVFAIPAGCGDPENQKYHFDNWITAALRAS